MSAEKSKTAELKNPGMVIDTAEALLAVGGVVDRAQTTIKSQMSALQDIVMQQSKQIKEAVVRMDAMLSENTSLKEVVLKLNVDLANAKDDTQTGESEKSIEAESEPPTDE